MISTVRTDDRLTRCSIVNPTASDADCAIPVADCADQAPPGAERSRGLSAARPIDPAHTLAPGATCSIVNTMSSTAKVARVAVPDEQWRDFRYAAVTQGISVSTYLARLV